MAKRKTAALVPLGCPKNDVDSEVILGQLEAAGFRIVEELEEAEVIIANTCAFIDTAQEESVEALLDLADYKQTGRCEALICAGCLGQRFGDELLEELPEVDGIFGPGDLGRAVDVVKRALRGEKPVETDGKGDLEADPPRCLSGPLVSRYVKIAEGCDHTCSFCIIPELRGPYRSRPPDAIAQECRRMAEAGTKEIVLVAQDTTAYGSDLDPPESLSRLLGSLRSLPFDGWVRVLYMHPDRVDEQLIETIGTHMTVVSYFDIPLQHSVSRLLKQMGRAGDPETYLGLVESIRQTIPEAALRTTFLLGYPGETEDDFEALLEFVNEARFDRATCFGFSAQDGTGAADLPDPVPAEVVAERIERLMATQEAVSLERNRPFEGQRLRVLIEQQDAEDGTWVGRSYRDAPEVDGQVILEDQGTVQTVEVGAFVWAVIEEALVHDLRGRIA
jgi:ribosomal protein S12 methylthiotransferase